MPFASDFFVLPDFRKMRGDHIYMVDHAHFPLHSKRQLMVSHGFARGFDDVLGAIQLQDIDGVVDCSVSTCSTIKPARHSALHVTGM